jgi:hypothetical protein
MVTLNEIQKFLAPRKMAMAGVSRNPKKFGGSIFKELKEKGFEIDRKKISFDSEVKSTGDYTATLDLHKEVKHKVAFSVVSE